MQGQDGSDDQETVTPDNDRSNNYHYMLQLSTVASSFPNLVKTDGQGYQFVDYVELIPLLVKAIQELSAQVEELSGRSLGEPISMMPSRSEGTASIADNDPVPPNLQFGGTEYKDLQSEKERHYKYPYSLGLDCKSKPTDAKSVIC